MKRNNDVYFITLIDLLVQILFLGLLLYVVAKAGSEKEQRRQDKESEAVQRLLKASGVSNITELTDELTKLAPLKELKGTADFIARAGGVAAANKILDTTKQVGGVDQLRTVVQDAKVMHGLVERVGGIDKIDAIVKKYEEGSGKPPCLFDMANGKKSVRSLATVVADDSTITFERTNPDLEAVLAALGTSYSAVQHLTFSEFSGTFANLTKIKPECRYTLHMVEQTDLVHARDAARFAFYLQITKQRK
jgi:hypothetical protein